MMKVGAVVLVLILILSISQPATAQPITGSVCIPARSDDPFVKEPPTLPNGQANSHGLRVKIDKRPAMSWPDRKSLKMDESFQFAAARANVCPCVRDGKLQSAPHVALLKEPPARKGFLELEAFRKLRAELPDHLRA